MFLKVIMEDSKLGSHFDIINNSNQIKLKISELLTKSDILEEQDIDDLLIPLMINMLNFFSNQIEEIISFDNLSEYQKNKILRHFKKVSTKIKSKNLKNVEDVINSLVIKVLTSFTFLEEKSHSYDKLELAKLSKLENFINNEINNLSQPKDESITQANIINPMMKGDIKKAIKNINLKVELNQEKSSFISKIDSAGKIIIGKGK